MEMHEKVMSYIETLREGIEERPQCFLMALMLLCKFPEAVLLYDNNHFITQIDGNFYDWDGLVKDNLNFDKFPEGYGDNHVINHYHAIKNRFIEQHEQS